MGQSLSSVSSLYTLTICSTLTALTLGTDYHLYLSNTTDTTLTCSSATPNDSCFIYCDTTPNTYAQRTFDCANSGHCEFICSASYCGQSATINAKNTAKDLTVTSSSTDCMRYATVWAPNNGDATLTNQDGSYLFATTINAGTDTQSITVNCATDCVETVINAQTAQYLHLIIASAFSGQRGIIKKVDAVVNCPEGSKYEGTSCVIDLGKSGSMQYSTINTINGIPQDLYIKTGYYMSGVTITCSAFDGVSSIASNDDIYNGDCYIQTTTPKPSSKPSLTTEKPSAKPSAKPSLTSKPTLKATTPLPTLKLLTPMPTPRPTPQELDTLTCGDQETGSFVTDTMFMVRMPSNGELIFIAETSANIESLEAYASNGNVVANDEDNDGRLQFIADKGDYMFILNVEESVDSTFHIYILCETEVITPEPTLKPSPKPTLKPTATPEPTPKPTPKPRKWTRKPIATTTKVPIVIETTESLYNASSFDIIFGSDFGVEIIAPSDTFKDIFLNNLGFFVLAVLALPLCVYAVIFTWKRSKKRKSEEWVALV